MKHLQIYVTAFIILSGSLMGCQAGAKKKKQDNKLINKDLLIDGYIVKPSHLGQSITLSGTIKPFEETVLMPEVTGRVVLINLQEGKFVSKGTLLVKLFDGDIQANLKKANTQLQLAQQTQKRQEELVKVNGISQLDFDQTVLQVSSIKNDIEVLQVQIGKTEIRAPYDGVVGLRNISLGAEVTPSTSLATLRMIDKLKLDFSVPGKYSNIITTGTVVNFSIQGDDKKYTATVLATEQGIEEETRNLRVRAVVNEKGTSLVVGAFASVELQLQHSTTAMMIPTQAIIPQELKKKLIVSDHGKAKFIDVKTGIRQDSMVEILSGLKQGDTVAITGILFLKPGVPLKFSKVISN